MNVSTALKWSAYYHVLAFGASLVGLAVVAAGLFLGLGDAVAALSGVSLSRPSSLTGVLSAVSPVPLVAGVAVGLLLRRVGRTAAFLRVQSRAVEEGVDLPVEALSSRVSDRVSDDVEAVVEGVADDGGTDSVVGAAAEGGSERAETGVADGGSH
ncbi:hypothetical protein GRX01_12125 [Halobaculum sp. WSA2]|uniref:Uncharacterized protein n=1 Tax=Halobaculum saliterrae TaxID=2073113 RepID=A0A6B0T0D4_9EURY|nr:hypothetical protein [Halobaculum saliterrae]MXR42082.1 hypothetical protein [Halobaculum saliterrae]